MSAARRSAEQKDAFGRANGIPPVVAKVVGVDFDKTLFEWGELNALDKRPLPGAVAAMRKLKDAGYKIVIITSRLTTAWLADEYEDANEGRWEQEHYLQDILDANGIPFDGMTGEKIPVEALFDDKAIYVSPIYPLSQAVEDFLAGDYRA